MALTICSDRETPCAVIASSGGRVERNKSRAAAIVAYVAQSIMLSTLDLNVASHTTRKTQGIVEQNIIAQEELFTHVESQSWLADTAPCVTVDEVVAGSD